MVLIIDDMAVYIANLGKYNGGYLVGAWSVSYTHLDVYKRQVLKNKGNQNAGNPQNHTPQGQPKKETWWVEFYCSRYMELL